MKISEEQRSALWHEVLKARLELKRNERSGRGTLPGVRLLAEMNLPPVHPRYRVPHAEAGHRLHSVVQTPDVPAPNLAHRTEPATPAMEAPEEGRDQPPQPASAPVARPVATSPVETDDAEHSGNVTLYLPKELNRWLAEHRGASGLSYRNIALNAVSWAATGERLEEIFPGDSSAVPANDIFGRPRVPSRPSLEPAEAETRAVNLGKDHVKVIDRLASTWTGGNRNAFLVGILSAYREHEGHRPV